MFKAICRTAAGWRRRFNQIRGVFARSGHPVDHLDDREIEAALTRGGECRIEEVPLSAKMIHFALRRLSSADGSTSGGKHFRRRKNERTARIQRA